MNKLALTLAISAIASIASTTALAQSAKFAAVYSDAPLVTVNGWSSVSTCTAILDPDYPESVVDCIDNTGSVATGYSMATIRVPNKKELLVGLSAQVGLYTETLVRGKKGSTSYAMAFSEGSVGLTACNADNVCYESVPRDIVLSNRRQELEATMAGIIEECSVEIDVTEDSGAFDLNDCTVAPEEIGLALETLAAHHYNFLFPNLPQGDYQVVAAFRTDAQTAARAYCDPDSPTYDYCIVEAEASAFAEAKAVINKAMMTIQQVRAVKGSLDMELVLID
jgi:hypothetical protein